MSHSFSHTYVSGLHLVHGVTETPLPVQAVVAVSRTRHEVIRQACRTVSNRSRYMCMMYKHTSAIIIMKPYRACIFFGPTLRAMSGEEMKGDCWTLLSGRVFPESLSSVPRLLHFTAELVLCSTFGKSCCSLLFVCVCAPREPPRGTVCYPQRGH